jgi:nicotinate phosphoribosyltransferase
MKNKMIINSLIDNDLYKFTMLGVVFRFFSRVLVTYKFKCRNASNWTKEMVEEVRREIDHYLSLKFKEKEIMYLNTLGYFSHNLMMMLNNYVGDKSSYTLQYVEGKAPVITFKGLWYLRILYEVPFLAIINEVYFRNTTDIEKVKASGLKRLLNKIEKALLSGIPFSDFGTRRRYSFEWQKIVLEHLMKLPNFKGTSNVYFAMTLGLTPIGTMAHEYIMCGAGMLDKTSIRYSQKFMLDYWWEQYQQSPNLLIALTDTYGSDAFIRDFGEDLPETYSGKTETLSEAFTGVRHDSGCPFEWGDKFIKHYESVGIDPMTKLLVFSDGLTIDKASELYEYFKDRINVTFGIGTHLTNDFEGVTPLQIVIKLTSVEGNPVAKISDSPGKGMC